MSSRGIIVRACEQSRKRSRESRKLGEAEWSGVRAWQKTVEWEQSAEREFTEWERSGAGWISTHGPLQPNISLPAL